MPEVTHLSEKLTSYIDPSIFPCTREKVLMNAERNWAPDPVLDAIERLPPRSYQDVRDIVSSFQPSTKALILSNGRGNLLA